MYEPSRTSRTIRFGLYEADLAAGELRRNGQKIKVQDRPFEILTMLLKRPGEVVTREEFRQKLWPADTFVDFDHSLNASINKLRQALDDAAGNPRFIATVGRRGYKFIAPLQVVDSLRLAEIEVKPNLASGGEMASFAAEPASFSPVPLTPPIARSLHWQWRAFGSLVTLAVMFIVWAWSAGKWPDTFRRNGRGVASEDSKIASAAVKPRRSFAVLGFKNLSGRPDEAWLSTALSEMLGTELAAGEHMRAIPGEKVVQARSDLRLADTDGYTPETLTRIRARLGSDVVVLGSYTALGEKSNKGIRVDLRLQDAITGETITEVATVGTEDQLFDLVSQAGARLREKLGVAAISVDEATSVRASVPTNQHAARLYAEGLDRIRVFDALSARDLLVKAVAVEPSYPLAHSALASAWSLLGYDRRSKEEARLAFELSEKLSRQDRLWVEGQYWETEKQWNKAVDVYKTLFAFFPDNLDYGLRLAQAQDWDGKPSDLSNTLESLRRLPSPLRDDPRIDAVEASVISPGDYATALAAADRAVKKGSAVGERHLVAQARGSQCAKLLNAGQTREAMTACQEAKQIYEVIGDHNGLGKELNNLAVLQYQQGALGAAKKMWRQALLSFREIGNDEGVGTTLMNIGAADYLQGNLPEADQEYQQALLKYRQVEDRDGEARVLGDLGQLLTEQGNLAAAKMKLQQALTITQSTNDKSVSAYVLSYLGDTLTKEGDFPAARKAYAQSLAIRNEIGEKASADEARIGLADLAIEEGRPGEAEKPAREAKSAFHQEGQSDDELVAAAVLAKASLAQGKSDEAKATIDSSSYLAEKTQNRGVAIRFEITSARVAVSSGRLREARSDLEAALTEATKIGFVSCQFEARLAIYEIEMRSDRSDQGRQHLEELAHLASAKGFGLIAQRASTAANNPTSN